MSAEELEAMARSEGQVGRAVDQVERFLAEVVAPVVGRVGWGKCGFDGVSRRNWETNDVSHRN